MKKKKTASIELGKRKVNYTLRPHKLAKRFRLTVYADRGLVVTVPKRGYDPILLGQFIKSHSDWIISKIRHFNSLRDKLGITGYENNYKEKRILAKELVLERINYFCSRYHFPLGKITVKNQRTRWGSCSGRGNLNFNYRVILLPKELADYVIFHELCHLIEFNHSQNFWALVEKELPDYKKLRQELKIHSLSFY